MNRTYMDGDNFGIWYCSLKFFQLIFFWGPPAKLSTVWITHFLVGCDGGPSSPRGNLFSFSVQGTSNASPGLGLFCPVWGPWHFCLKYHECSLVGPGAATLARQSRADSLIFPSELLSVLSFYCDLFEANACNVWTWRQGFLCFYCNRYVLSAYEFFIKLISIKKWLRRKL